MGYYSKEFAKNSLKIASGFAMISMAKTMKEHKRQMLENPQPIPTTGSIRSYDFGIYEGTVVRVIGVISSLMEVILKNGVEVDPYTMKEAQEIVSGFQELMDMKKVDN